MKYSKEKVIDILEKKIILLVLIVLVVVMIEITWKYNEWLVKSEWKFVEAVIAISNSSRMEIKDTFYLLWGMPVTLILFLVEFGNSYWYGVTLKRIINLSLDKRMLVLGSTIYMLLCPMVYIAETYEKRITSLWCVLCTFVTFCGSALYIIYKTRKKEIRRLLCCSTRKELKKKAEKLKSGVSHLQREIESLSLYDMIRHVNYSDTNEVKELIETISTLLQEEQIRSITKGNVYEQSIIMVWVEGIIESSGLNSLNERERTGYVLRKMWENITNHIEQEYKEKKKIEEEKQYSNYKKIKELNEEKRRRTIDCTVQILCPLIKVGTIEASEVFRVLWGNIRTIHAEVIWYLFMYEEYLYYSRGTWKRNHCISMEGLEKDRRTLSIVAVKWDKEMAWKFWRTWVILKEPGNNMAMELFCLFCEDVEWIRKNRMQYVKTYVMRRYYWETR